MVQIDAEVGLAIPERVRNRELRVLCVGELPFALGSSQRVRSWRAIGNYPTTSRRLHRDRTKDEARLLAKEDELRKKRDEVRGGFLPCG